MPPSAIASRDSSSAPIISATLLRGIESVSRTVSILLSESIRLTILGDSSYRGSSIYDSLASILVSVIFTASVASVCGPNSESRLARNFSAIFTFLGSLFVCWIVLAVN